MRTHVNHVFIPRCFDTRGGVDGVAKELEAALFASEDTCRYWARMEPESFVVVGGKIWLSVIYWRMIVALIE